MINLLTYIHEHRKLLKVVATNVPTETLSILRNGNLYIKLFSDTQLFEIEICEHRETVVSIIELDGLGITEFTITR